MGILSAIGAFFTSVGQVFGWASKRSDLNNTEDMKKADLAQKQNSIDDQINKEIQDRNEAALRDRLSS